MPTINNSVPYEIIGAPFTMWVAPVGTAFPLITAAPSASWFKVGTSGDLNISEGGVKVSHPQTINKFRAFGDSGSRKVFRSDEDLMISLELADVSLEQYALALNGNTVTTVAAGVAAGYKKLGLSRGLFVDTRALLLRGPSPYGEDWNMQYEVPRAAQSGSPEVTYVRADAALLSLEWTALVDPDAASVAERFGRLVAQHADALT